MRVDLDSIGQGFVLPSRVTSKPLTFVTKTWFSVARTVDLPLHYGERVMRRLPPFVPAGHARALPNHEIPTGGASCVAERLSDANLDGDLRRIVEETTSDTASQQVAMA